MPKPKHPRARLSPARDEILVIPIARESVLAGDIGPTLEKLEPLSATREAALKWEGTMTLYFEGRDDDPREISEIPEIRAYFAITHPACAIRAGFSQGSGRPRPVLRLTLSEVERARQIQRPARRRRG